MEIKKKIKLISKILIVFLLVVFLVSCDTTTSNYVKLPDLTNLSRQKIKTKLDRLDISYSFKFVERIYQYPSEYDKFVSYGNDLEIGDRVEKGSRILVFTTALNLPTENVVNLTMDLDYEGKNFIDDGIEEVTLARTIDGDTAHFYLQDGTYVKVRFLGIDAPESTREHDPWGMAASHFTADILNNAETIVLEAEGNRTDTYGRYLAFVWADGVLVNLEVVQNAYSNSKLSSSSKYFDAFYDTELVISQTGRRVWGEIDPDYDYENKTFK